MVSLPRAAALSLLGLALAGCGDAPAPEAYHPRVQVQSVTLGDYAASATLTGDVRARIETQLSFRIGGQITERLVDVGDHVRAGQVLARLDPQDQQNNLRAAEASATAQRAQAKQANADLWRQQQLLPKGYTSRSEYDSALAAQRGAKNALATAEAQLADAREQLGYTELKADADGVITARQAESGQVVQASGPVFSLARDGDRDAVFNVYEALLSAPEGQTITVTLLDDPQVSARGVVREVTPTVAADSGTVQVKVALTDPPPAMALGTAVSASAQNRASQAVELPWAALTKQGREPAVWVVEGDTVNLRPVTVGRYLTGKVVVSAGLKQGERVVTAGGQLLHPDQVVEIAGTEGGTP